MTAINEVIHHEQDMIRNWIFFKNVLLIMFNILYYDIHCLKIKCLKGWFSRKITKNGKMTDVWRHASKTGHDRKNNFFSNCIYDHAEQFLPWLTSLENQVKVPIIGIKSTNYWKTAKWLQWNLSIADMLYSGHLSIADTFSRNQISPAMVKHLYFEPLYSGHLCIADTFSENQWCPLLRGFTVVYYDCWS